MKVFEKEPLESLKFVIQTGGNNPKVKLSFTAPEGIGFAQIMFNKMCAITPAGRCLVFANEGNGEYRGYIKMVDGMPKKFKPEPEDEGTHFNDWYTMVGA